MRKRGSPPPGFAVLDSYSIRMMVGWVVSLGILLLLTKLPMHQSPNRGGWSATSSNPPPEQIELKQIGSHSPPTAAPPVQSIDASLPSEGSSVQRDRERSGSSSQKSVSQEGPSEPSSSSAARVRRVTTLGPEAKKPDLIGGTGALYHEINYPKEARKRGIEGSLKLEFTVQTDGSVTDIEVIQPLHPLCDSAAVAGLRSVRFTPAETDGTKIPVRLRLPVEFRLVSVPQTASTTQ